METREKLGVRNPLARCGTALMLIVLVAAPVAVADVTSDEAAAILVYPVVLVASDSCVDTLIQISNTSNQPQTVRCFYVNADGRCSTTGAVCFSGAECSGGVCLPHWQETDFVVQLTARQPMGWLASEGLSKFCTPTQIPGERCIPLDGATRRSANGQSNAGTHVPAVSDDPFLGELKCVVVDDQFRPTDRNVLVGSATTVATCPDCLDVTRHNAIGIQAVPGANNGDNTLVLGEEYNACPNTLILNHYFDGAQDPVTNDPILGALVLVPCSEDFVMQERGMSQLTAQFLVFNEFEQRFSTSTGVQCYASLPLSNIDTTQALRSIFYAGVAGTLTGQTRIQGVGPGGHGLLGVYFDLHGTQSSAANLHFQGVSDQPDIIRLP